jgi:hypothetical protein
MKKIPANFLLIIKTVFPLIVIVVLFFFVGLLAKSKITYILAKIADAKKDQGILTEKLDVLSTIAVTGVNDSNVATNALPSTNAALTVVSQLKTEAARNGLIVSSIKSKTNPESGTEINSYIVNFTVVGPKSNIETFLLNINMLSPITTLSKIKLAELNGVVSGDVTASSYWSDLPTTLPATIQEFEDLTPEDKQTLTTISGLTQPAFITLPPANTEAKPDPFK